MNECLTPVVHTPLARLALCGECEATFDLGYTDCPACGAGSASITTVSRLLEQRRRPAAEGAC